jgi:hypothetical protein
MAIHVCVQSYVSSVPSISYVTTILIGCFKSRSRVAHVAMALVAGGQLFAAVDCYCCWGAAVGHCVGA